MATIIKLRPLPEAANKSECQEWAGRLALIEQYLKKRGCYYTHYPNGNHGWENQQQYIKEVVRDLAIAQGYEFEWEGGTPSICSIATLRLAPD